MSQVRNMVNDRGMGRAGAGGDIATELATPLLIAADAADTLTATKICSGVVVYSGFTAGRNITLDTAANILLAIPDLAVGECVEVQISSTAAFAGTFVAATGVTLKGRATVPASSHVHCYLIRTGAATFDWLVL